MGIIRGGTWVRHGTGPDAFFAMLAMVLVMMAAVLLIFPARALAAPAELSITKQGPTRVEPKQKFDYVLTVSNAQGAQDAAPVTVEDELPTGVTFDEAEAPADVTCTLPPASTITCTVPTLAAGESKTITLKVTAPMNVGEITNRASASSADDTNSPVKSNEITTTVAPNLVIDKLDDPDPVNTEDVLLYTLRVQNLGNTNATGVTVKDKLPLDVLDFVTVDSHDFDCEYKAGIVKCSGGSLAPDDIAKVEIVVEPEKAETIQNTGAVFVEGVNKALDTDTEKTVVSGGGGGGGGGGGNGGGGTPGGNNLPEGNQCSPVVERGTENPIGVLSGTTPQGFIFTNIFNDVLPLRIVYATSSENGSLTITAKPKAGGDSILDKTIQGKKRGVIVVDTDPGVDYEIQIQPEDQGYAIQFEMGVGPEPCTNPSELDPPAVPGGNDGTNGDSGDGGANGADDVIDETISDRPLPNTGGPPLLVLAMIAFGLAVSGASVVGVRRRGR